MDELSGETVGSTTYILSAYPECTHHMNLLQIRNMHGLNALKASLS